MPISESLFVFNDFRAPSSENLCVFEDFRVPITMMMMVTLLLLLMMGIASSILLTSGPRGDYKTLCYSSPKCSQNVDNNEQIMVFHLSR